MKKMFLSVAALTLIFGATLLTSCTKNDTTAPVITLVGSETVTVTLGGTYTDAGATAKDDVDGDITSSIVSTASATNPNTNLAGTYTITYTVSDAAGNTGTKTRTVNVVNSVSNMAGGYTVSGTFDGSPDVSYTTETVTASSTINNRILFAGMAAYSSASVYANINVNAITIPTQDVVCGTDHISRQFAGMGTITDATHFSISGTVALTSDPSTTLAWSYNFTKN